ncbi:hypothetical protein C7S13_3381 [Burkholderia cepacia]|nr:hypothetical protein [Burkholderia cepacia]
MLDRRRCIRISRSRMSSATLFESISTESGIYYLSEIIA